MLDMNSPHRVTQIEVMATASRLTRTRWAAWLRRVAAVTLLGTLAAGLSFAIRPAPVDAARPHQIVIRASGTSGAERMVLKVNGQEAARWVVAKGTAGYTFDVVARSEVSTVEVAFINDGAGRDLKVDFVDIGGVTLQSESTDTRSTGTYLSGQGCRARASVSEWLHCNGSFTYAVPAGLVLGPQVTSGQVVNVRARGATGNEQFQLRLNGKTVLWRTVGTTWSVFSYTIPAGDTIINAEVHFSNSAGSNDLRVDYLEIDGRKLQSEATSTRSTGTYLRGQGCRARASVSEWLHCSGSFTYAVPATTSANPVPQPVVQTPDTEEQGPTNTVPSTTSTPPSTTAAAPDAPTASPKTQTLGIRAMGRSGSEIMHLRVNGTAVKSWTVASQWKLYTFDVASTTDIAQAEVQFVNDASTRDLRVDYLELDGTRFQSESSATLAKGSFTQSTRCNERRSTSEWLYCNGWFRYALGGQSAPVTAIAPAPALGDQTAAAGSTDGSYTIAQVIDGTIGHGDGTNPNEEAPMGRHDAPLYLPQGWNWAQGPTRNSVWGQLGTGGSKYAEFRCAVIPENGHRPPVAFRINVREGAYYQFANSSWRKGFDADLTGGNHGGYLGRAGRVNQDPFSSGSHGQIQWRREADGSYSAPWNSAALMMHFWAGQRKAPAAGQTAEFLTSEVRLQQPDGKTVDLSKVKVLFQCGVDYYNTTGGQGTKVPGPGIAKYHRVTTGWTAGLWITLPGNAAAGSVRDFDRWIRQNPPPNVQG
ncbi:MAG: hypothetical protein ACI81L_002434 [Verrucomicrobiales bacterium]|jgi:hypothetical protein